MKKIKLLLIAFSVFAMNSCTDEVEAPGTPYVTFQAATYDFGVDIGSSNSNDIKIYTANMSSSERTFNVYVVTAETTADPASYIVPTSITIPANSNVGTLTVNISDTNISSAGETLTIAFEAKAGQYNGEPIVLSIKQVCPWDEVFLTINFDDWGSETGFSIIDSLGAVIVDVPQGTWNDGDVSYSTKWCLAPGTYTFTITDYYSDGICCSYGMGDYALTVGGTTLASGGQFGASESTTFTLQ